MIMKIMESLRHIGNAVRNCDVIPPQFNTDLNDRMTQNHYISLLLIKMEFDDISCIQQRMKCEGVSPYLETALPIWLTDLKHFMKSYGSKKYITFSFIVRFFTNLYLSVLLIFLIVLKQTYFQIGLPLKPFWMIGGGGGGGGGGGERMLDQICPELALNIFSIQY